MRNTTSNALTRVAALTATALLTLPVHASGFKLNEQSASGVGTAYAGRAAVAEDASVVFFNPAGMTKLTRAELSVGATYINLDGRFQGSRVNPVGTPSSFEAGAYDNGGDFFPNPVIPFLYYVHPVDERFSVGLGIFVPYGTNSDYSKNALVGGFAGETSLKSIDIQPTFAYRFTDTLAIGVGIDIVYAKGRLTKQLDLVPYVPNPGHPLNNDAFKGYENTFIVEGDDYGYGFNVGVMWDISPATTFGFAYRSEIDFDLTGDSEFKQDTNVQVFNEAAGAVVTIPNVNKQASRVPITGPRSATFSLAHQVNDALQVQGGITWTDWSTFKYFDIIATKPGIIDDLSGLGENYIGHIIEKWHDTLAYAIGATYTLNDQWLFRLGYAFDESPVQEQYRTARVPDNDRQWLTGGFRYTVNRDVSVDLGMAYLFMDQSKLDEYNYDLSDSRSGVENAKGTYDIDAFGLSLQLNYRM